MRESEETRVEHRDTHGGGGCGRRAASGAEVLGRIWNSVGDSVDWDWENKRKGSGHAFPRGCRPTWPRCLLDAGGWCSAAGCWSLERAGAQRRSRFFSVGGCGARGRVWAGEVGSGPRRMDHRLGFLDSNKSEPVVGATTQLSPLGLNLNSDGGTFPTSQCHIWFSSFSKKKHYGSAKPN